MRPRRPAKIIQNIRINIFVNHFKTGSKVRRKDTPSAVYALVRSVFYLGFFVLPSSFSRNCVGVYPSFFLKKRVK